MIEKETFFIIIFGGFLSLIAFFMILWHILHLILCSKYDDQLFKEPIFNQVELGIYSSWPLSLVRSMGYILLIAAPKFFITKKRFKEVTIDRSNIYILAFFCRIFLLAFILSFLFLLVMLTAGIAPETFSVFISN